MYIRTDGMTDSWTTDKKMCRGRFAPEKLYKHSTYARNQANDQGKESKF